MNLEVETTGGRIRGRSRRGIALFAGIPYAAPPVGELRWAPPQPAPRWRGVRDATRFGLAAPQVAATGMAGRLEVPWREDCLTLNVATPAADGGSRPVLVWIHGGAFRHGTSATPWYDGTSFAARGDVVVVSLNYRLGALGFCRLPGEPTSGLNGILDQIAALEWVRDNISAFGGDPAQVTVAGESAGAFSVVTLLSMERSAGLFQRAIAQSGAGHHVLGASRAALVAESLLHELDAADIDEARQRSTVEVLAAQSRVEARAHELLSRVEQPFYPSIDGDLLPARPVDLLVEGAGAEVALLTGTNADEMTLFGLGATTEESLAPAMAHYVDPPDELIGLYRAAHPEASAGQIAGLFANFELTGQDPAYLETYRDNLAAVTAEDVMRVAREHLRPDEVIILAVGNVDDMLAGDPEHPDTQLPGLAPNGSVTRIPLPDPMTMEYPRQ